MKKQNYSWVHFLQTYLWVNSSFKQALDDGEGNLNLKRWVKNDLVHTKTSW